MQNYSLQTPKSRRREPLTITATTAAVFVVVLISQPQFFATERWLTFTLSIVVFAVLANWTPLLREGTRVQWGVLGLQTLAALGVVISSNLFFLAPMLTFITVSEAQLILPQRAAYVFAALLAMGLGALFAWGTDWSAGVQAGLGYAAGYVFIVAFTQIAQREERARDQLELAHQQLREYAAQVERLATVRERNRIAREVHDSLGHYLTALNVQLEIAAKLHEADPTRAREAIVRARELVAEGLREARRSVAALRASPLDDRPLAQALGALVDNTRDANLTITFEQTGVVRALSPEIETVLYRAAQEALTNIRKHSRATQVVAQLNFDADTVRLWVRDNGAGRAAARDGVGLSGLRERVLAVGGKMWAQNYRDGGFAIEVIVPSGAHNE